MPEGPPTFLPNRAHAREFSDRVGSSQFGSVQDLRPSSNSSTYRHLSVNDCLTMIGLKLGARHTSVDCINATMESYLIASRPIWGSVKPELLCDLKLNNIVYAVKTPYDSTL